MKCSRLSFGLLLLALPMPGGAARAAAADPHLLELERLTKELRQRRQSPAGVLPLLGVVDHWRWVPPEAVTAVVEIARGRASHPLVRSVGDYLALGIALHRGELERARALRQAGGWVPRWLACGPFASHGQEGHDAVYQPEQELRTWPSKTQRYAGKYGPVTWRSLPPPGVELRQPELPLDGAGESVIYLQTFVRAERRQAAALRIGVGEPYKVFLNGRLRGGRSIKRTPRPDQEAWGLWLGAGVNRLVVKLTLGSGHAELFARLTRPDGGVLGGVTFLDDMPLDDMPADRRLAEGSDARPRVLELGEWLRARPRLASDWGRYLLRVAPVQAQVLEEQVARWALRVGSAEAHTALARLRRDPNDARGDLGRALQLSPRDPWARLERAQLEERLRPTGEAAQQLERLAADEPHFVAALLARAESHRMSGLASTAAALLDEALRQRGAAAPAQLLVERADLALQRGEVGLARRIYERYLLTNQDDLAVHRILADLALRRGDGAAAVSQLRRAIAVAPHLASLQLELARALEGAGDLRGALACYRQALLLDPRSVQALERMGYVLQRSGARAEAFAAWRQALQLQPQASALRAYLNYLDPQQARGLAEQLRLDVRPLIAQARAKPLGEDPARVLLEARAVEVHPGGLSRMLRQRLLRVERPAGIPHASRVLIQFSPARQTVEVKVARVHRASGQVSAAAAQHEIDLNEPWAGRWYDLRARVIEFSGLQAGDIVEVEYLVEDIARENLLGDQFGALVFLREVLPVEQFRYNVIMPAGDKLAVRQPRAATSRYAVEEREGRRIYRWSAGPLPRITVEPGMPGWSEVADYVHVSTFTSWEAVGRWYWELVAEQLAGDQLVSETARRVTAGATSELERVRLLHNFVARTTRYVGLEFGIHSYKPYAASQVLGRRFGDCKDKATLLIALLGAVGVEAELALVRTLHQGTVEPAPASLAPFDHALVYVPAHALYLDATAEFAGSAELPAEDQDVMALHISRAGARLVRTPQHAAAENASSLHQEVELRADGSARVREKRVFVGEAAAQWRSHYQAADQRRERYEKMWNEAMGGGAVTALQMPDLDQLERPVRVSAELEVRGMAQPEGLHRLALQLGVGSAARFVPAYARLSSRVQPLRLAYPWHMSERVKVRGPAGWRIVAVPHDRALDASFGRYVRRVQQNGDMVECQQEIELKATRIAAAEYPAFRRFLAHIDRWISEPVVLERGSGR